MPSPLHATQNTASLESRLSAFVGAVIEPMGYEVVWLEVVPHKPNRTLRVFIDFVTPTEGTAIGIEDCVRVTKALDQPLEALAESEPSFSQTYDLEVSSPGVDRPLKREKDYTRFKGRRIRVHTFRALASNEIGDAAYGAKNPKQKNFLGELIELDNPEHSLETAAIRLRLENTGPEIRIPLKLVSKAHLDPIFDFEMERKLTS